jgi:hypothetical protein
MMFLWGRRSFYVVCQRSPRVYRGWFAANGSPFGYKGKSASHIFPGLTADARLR